MRYSTPLIVHCLIALAAGLGCQTPSGPQYELKERKPRPAEPSPSGQSATPAAGPSAPARHEFTHHAMGSPFKLVLYGSDEAAAKAAAEVAFQRVDQLNAVFSDYDPASELSRLSATAGSGQSVKVSDDLWRLLRESDRFSRQTGGAFDITVGPVVTLWRAARKSGKMPPADELAKAIQAVGYQKIEFDEGARSVKLREPGMRLDLGGIAVGYTLDDLMATLKSKGFTRVLIDAGGDILVGDAPPDREGWRIGAAVQEKGGPPTRYVILANASITTSGDMFRFVEIDGKRYSHIVDPRTGLGMTDHSNVTLIAKDAITADALATAVSVMGPVKGVELIDRVSGAATIIMHKPADKVESYESRSVQSLKIEKS